MDELNEQQLSSSPEPVDQTVATAETTDPNDRSGVIRSALEKSMSDEEKPAPGQPSNRGKHAGYQPRESGKFAPGKPNVPPVERPLMPKSLRRELQSHWDTSPPELLSAIIQREQDFDKGAATWKSKADQAEAILKQFEPYQWILKNENATPEAAIGSLLQTAALLRTGTPAQKAYAVHQMLGQFGIPIQHLQQFQQSNGQQGAQVNDPAVARLTEQMNALQQELHRRDQDAKAQAEEAQQLAPIHNIIAKFGAANPHFSAVQDKVLGILNSGLLGDMSSMSHEQKLQAAYDAAIKLDPAISAQVLAQQQAKQSSTTVQALRAARQVTGAPSSAAVGKPAASDRRAVIENAVAQYN